MSEQQGAVAAPERAESDSRERQLTVVQRADSEAQMNYRLSTAVAGLCKDLAKTTAVKIAQRDYIPASTWCAIAVAHGFMVGTRNVEKVDGGVRAIGELKNIQTGMVVATGEGFVGEDEPTWFGGDTEFYNRRINPPRMEKKTMPPRPMFAIRAMAQTRAAGRTCKQALAHVVVLMNAGLETTVAEEVIDNELVVEESGRATNVAVDYGEPIYDWRNIHLNVPHLKKHGPGCDKKEPTDYPHGRQLGELSKEALAYYQQKFAPTPNNVIEKRIRRALDISMGREPADVKGEEPPA